MPDRILFVDLDHTLILENSFHSFLYATARSPSLRAKLAVARFAALKATYGYKRTSEFGRVRAKASIVESFERLPQQLRSTIVAAVVQSAQRAASGPVLQVVEEWRSIGAAVVLATAAPSCYARAIASHFGIGEVICSDRVAEHWVERIGPSKAEACAQRISRAETPLVGVITDHRDDVPLLRLADRAIIAAPPREAQAIAAAAGLDSTQWRCIDTVSSQFEGGWWFFFHGELLGPLDDHEAYILLSKWRDCLTYTERGWEPAHPGFRGLHPVKRDEAPKLPAISIRIKLEVRTWWRRRIGRMTH